MIDECEQLFQAHPIQFITEKNIGDRSSGCWRVPTQVALARPTNKPIVGYWNYGSRDEIVGNTIWTIFKI
jgi:hypothetical protein